MSLQPSVTAVIPIFNSKEATLALLESMRASRYGNLSVIIVDDGSTDGSAEAIADRFPEVKILTGDGNLWWSGATNLGIRSALNQGAQFILTLNNDNEVEADFLEPLVETALKNPRSLVSAKIIDHDQRDVVSAFGGRIFWWLGEIRDCTSRLDDVSFASIRECDFLPGRCILIPAEAFRDVGLFDDVNCPQYFGDAEFSCRAKKRGYHLLAEPRSIVYNRSASSGGTALLDRGRLREIILGKRSAFYYNANRFFYEHYCPHFPYQLFLALRYARLAYSLLRRRTGH